MIGISFWRVVRAALKNFWRNIWLSVATTMIMTITLLMILFLYFMSVLGNNVIVSIQDKVDLLIEFKDNVQPQYIDAVAAEVRTRSDVKEVKVTTSEQALAEFRAKRTDKPLIEDSLKELGDNPLPASMSIVAKDPKDYENIAKQLQSDKYSPYVDKVNYINSKVVIDRLISVIRTTRNLAVGIAVIFAILVVLIMFNTIRLAIYSFREEIDIMRLVGASRWFIQGPFIIEAMVVALVAVLVATILGYGALRTANPYVLDFFRDTTFDLYRYGREHWLTVVGLELLVGLLLAIFSSWVAVRRYLRD